ncbi:MAG TPA: TRAP transporter substrate-binding protein [Geminicoccaceae bacterium]|nr:TRAP transporter substrate-binding protein [Geminicoccaceae bacterium]
MSGSLKGIGVAVALGTAAALAPGASAAELPRTQLKVIGLQSHLNSYKAGEVPFWEERIPAESNGQVTARLTAQDVHGLKGPEILRLMKLGVIDFASGVLSYMAGDNAEFEAIDLPGLSPDMATTRKIAEAYEPVLAEIMEEQYGVKLLMLFPSPPQVFWCRPEIQGTESLPGKSVRVFNKSMADMVSGFGATSVTMPFTEVTPALERGVIDCAITGTLSGNTNKMFEVTSHMYPLYMGWSMHFHGASLDSWNALDPAVQEFLLGQFEEFNDRLWTVVAEEEQDGIDCSIGKDPCKYGYKGGMTLVEVSGDDLERQREILESTILPDWAQRCGKDCAETWNETIGAALGMSIDADKL